MPVLLHFRQPEIVREIVTDDLLNGLFLIRGQAVSDDVQHKRAVRRRHIRGRFDIIEKIRVQRLVPLHAVGADDIGEAENAAGN